MAITKLMTQHIIFTELYTIMNTALNNTSSFKRPHDVAEMKKMITLTTMRALIDWSIWLLTESITKMKYLRFNFKRFHLIVRLFHFPGLCH